MKLKKNSIRSPAFRFFYYLSLLAGTGSILTWTDRMPFGAISLAWAIAEVSTVLVGWGVPLLAKQSSVPSWLTTWIPIGLVLSTVGKISLMLFFAAA